MQNTHGLLEVTAYYYSWGRFHSETLYSIYMFMTVKLSDMIVVCNTNIINHLLCIVEKSAHDQEKCFFLNSVLICLLNAYGCLTGVTEHSWEMGVPEELHTHATTVIHCNVKATFSLLSYGVPKTKRT